VVGVALLAGSTTAFAQLQGNNGGTNAVSATGSYTLDPGVRSGPAGAGGPLDGMSTDDQNFFTAALARFQPNGPVRKAQV
jgi:hypothetical protein